MALGGPYRAHDLATGCETLTLRRVGVPKRFFLFAVALTVAVVFGTSQVTWLTIDCEDERCTVGEHQPYGRSISVISGRSGCGSDPGSQMASRVLASADDDTQHRWSRYALGETPSFHARVVRGSAWHDCVWLSVGVLLAAGLLIGAWRERRGVKIVVDRGLRSLRVTEPIAAELPLDELEDITIEPAEGDAHLHTLFARTAERSVRLVPWAVFDPRVLEPARDDVVAAIRRAHCSKQ